MTNMNYIRNVNEEVVSRITVYPAIPPAYIAYESGTECSETSGNKIQTPGNHPKEVIQHSEDDESLKTRIASTY